MSVFDDNIPEQPEIQYDEFGFQLKPDLVHYFHNKIYESDRIFYENRGPVEGVVHLPKREVDEAMEIARKNGLLGDIGNKINCKKHIDIDKFMSDWYSEQEKNNK